MNSGPRLDSNRVLKKNLVPSCPGSHNKLHQLFARKIQRIQQIYKRWFSPIFNFNILKHFLWGGIGLIGTRKWCSGLCVNRRERKMIYKPTLIRPPINWLKIRAKQGQNTREIAMAMNLVFMGVFFWNTAKILINSQMFCMC